LLDTTFFITSTVPTASDNPLQMGEGYNTSRYNIQDITWLLTSKDSWK